MLRKKIGEFYLTEHIGSGGMSEVYLALNPRTREKRAIKIIARRATTAPKAYARFLREIEIIRTLSHPNIVKILASGVLEDGYYYMMAFMSGGSLSRRLACGRMPLDQTMSIFKPICDALAYAHGRGIIHRDLKPANILLSSTGLPMVSDFGIAKVLDSGKTTLTKSNEILGTIAYLAPEQRFSTKKVDHRADVYALGAILYEMVVGFPPLGKFPWPREMQPEFPQAIQAILEKCLAFDPVDRYLHGGGLLLELEKYLTASGGTQTDTRKQVTYDLQQRPKKEIRFPPKTDRLENWFQILRTGTTRERLAVVRAMVERMEPDEAKVLLKLYASETDRVRWGLIRVFGQLRINAATPILLNELKNPFHRECAIEALGKIGSDEAFDAIRRHVDECPESAMIALTPLARTGKRRAINLLRHYLTHEMAIMRHTAVRALGTIEEPECLGILSEHLRTESDDKVRCSILQAIHTLGERLSPGGKEMQQNTEPAMSAQVAP